MAFMRTRTASSLKGVDVSQFQGSVNWTDVINDGIEFAYARASTQTVGGTLTTDTEFVTNAQNARSAGMPIGGYHFARPTNDLQDARDAADHFISVLESGFGTGDYGDIFPMLDFEVLEGQDGTISITDALAWMDEFRTHFKDNTGRQLILYTAIFFIQSNNEFNDPSNPLVDMPLWAASLDLLNPQHPESGPEEAGGWTDWFIWQHSFFGNVDGITDTQFNDASIGTGDGSTTVFNLTGGPISIPTIRVDGVEQTLNDLNSAVQTDGDFFISNFDTGDITFFDPPANGAAITGDWGFPASDLDAGPDDIALLQVPSVPTGLTASPDDGQVTLNWNANPEIDITGYNIYQDTVEVQSGVFPPFTITGLTNGTSFNFQVSAIDQFEESGLSAIVSATPTGQAGFYGGRLEIDMADPLTFERNSTAVDENGNFLAIDEGNFAAGKFNEGLLIEEDTTNLLGTDGFLNTTISNAIADGWIAHIVGTPTGTRSVQTGTFFGDFAASQELDVTVAAGGEEFGISSALVACDTINTASFLVNVTALGAGGTVRLLALYFDNTPTLLETEVFDITATTSGFERFELAASSNASITQVRLRAFILDDTGTCYIQVGQTENKPFATSFTDGTRARTIVKVPTAKNVISATEGTISLWVDVNDKLKNTDETRYLFSTTTNTGTFDNTIALRRNVSNQWQVWVRDDATNETFVTVADVLADGFHLFTVRWTASAVDLFIDGSSEGTAASPNLPVTLDPFIYLGNFANETVGNINTVMDDVRFSPFARDSATIGTDFSNNVEIPLDFETRYLLRFDNSLQRFQAAFRDTPSQALTNVLNVESSFVHWIDVIYPNTSIEIETTLDGGTTFDPVTNKGDPVPNATGDLSSNTLQARLILKTEQDLSPKLINFYWRIVWREGGGFILPFELPTEFVTFDTDQNIFISGDLSVPFFATINGQIQNFTITNVTTGKLIKVDISIAAGESVEIDTTFGQKSIVKIDTAGNRTNAMNFLDIDVSEFWQLVSGTNEISFDADVNVNGSVTLVWRNLFAGV